MRLVIAEKPSVAAALAAALGVKNKKDGYMEGGGYLILILSRLVDTFFSRISLTMPLPPKFHNTAYVLLWEEDLHWQSRSSGCSSS